MNPEPRTSGAPSFAPGASSAPGRPRALLTDLGLMGGVFAVFFGLVVVAREWGAPLDPAPALDLSPSLLPKYALFSLARGIAAFALSLAFTLVYGKLAAASRRAERVLLPLLDVLQSIPVLSFMPGFVLALTGLFPGSNVGLELACVLAIFTGQVWNLTFSFHASLRTIPVDLVDAARMNGFGPLRRLVSLEIPCAATGLVWNSMVSMAGGWFFLTVVEAFTLDGRAYRLPGLGSYMAAAVEAGDRRGVGAAIAAMVAIIVALDQLVWRPLLVWAERFRHEDTGVGDPPRSWLLIAFRRSALVAALKARAAERRRLAALAAEARAATPLRADDATTPAGPRRALRAALRALRLAGLLGGAAFTVFGAVELVRLLAEVDLASWLRCLRSLGFTALRVAGSLVVGLLWAAPVGVVIGRSRALSRVLQPVIQLAASFPAPMVFPLVVPALLRVGVPADAVAAGLMMLGTQWYLLFNAAAGAASTPRDLRDASAVFSVPRLRRFALVDLAAAYPYVLTGLVAAAGGAWNASIVSEVVVYAGGELRVEGIGSFVSDAFAAGDHPRLAAAVTTLAFALVLINRLGWRPLQRLAVARFTPNR